MRFTKKIVNSFKYRLQVLLSWYAYHFMKPPTILSLDETLDLIIKDHYSISRNGDGELNLMMGESIDFQKSDKKISLLLKEALNANIKKYISCLPSIFIDYSRFHDKAKAYFDNYLKSKRFFYYNYAKSSVYGDAFLSRFYIDFKNKAHSSKQVERLKQIWKNQNVVLVEGKDSRLGVNNDLFNKTKSLKRILGPSINAFNKHDELLESIKHIANKDTLILLALGPTASIMAYELAKDGFWAVDIGHIDIEYEWFRMGVEEKVNIPGKYTNECDNVKFTGSLPEKAMDQYKSEIVVEIL